MPRLEIKKEGKVLAVVEKPGTVKVRTVKDYKLKTPQMKEGMVLKGKTIVLKGQYSEIKLFPEDIEKITARLKD